MKTFLHLFFVIIFFSWHARSEKNHRHEDAHVHGNGELTIAFDKQIGKIEFKTPADSIVGFEYEPKNENDKITLEKNIEKFDSNIKDIIQFDPSLGCDFKKNKIEVKRKGHHADFVADYAISCNKEVKNSSVTFNFLSFKQISEIKVTLLLDSIQKSFQIKSSPLRVELK